ncbi:MAG TPA: PIN domain-containing protein [Patescibacteria group bacterium]|nr:PIN domain-containing protein [Patescibacteria group bacterium]
MYLVDTNIHAAYLLQNYENDDVTRQYLHFYETVSLVDRAIPDFILGEFETFMMQVVPSRYNLQIEDKRKIQQLTTEYMQNLTTDCTLIVPDTETFQYAKDIYFEYLNSHYISFVDALVLATADRNSYPILTKDERMKLLAKRMNISFFQPDII